MSLTKVKSLLNNHNFDFYYLDEVDSTMLKIKTLFSKNNICLMANKQTKGLGRRGAHWISPEGNVHISILLKNILNIKNHFINTAFASVTICNVIDKLCGIESKIKWPNDILINDKKICGIISEIYNRNNEILINTGLGINIVTSPIVNEYITTHVNEYNKNINNFIFVYEFMQEYLKSFDILKSNSKTIMEQYKSKLILYSKNIKLKLDNNKIKEGFFYGLNDDGSLILKNNLLYENIYNARILK